MPTVSQLPLATSVTTDDLLLLINGPDDESPAAQKARVGDLIALMTPIFAGAAWKGVWSNATTYVLSDFVSYNGSVYVSLLSTNLAQNPETQPLKWQKIISQGPKGPAGEDGDDSLVPGPPGLPSAWNAATWTSGTYTKGTAVRHPTDGASYVAVVASATSDPSVDHGSGGAWRKISDRGLQGVKPFGTPTVWQAAHAYSIGNAYTPADSVFHTDSSYVCLVNHTSTSTFADDLAANKWQVITAPGGVATVQATFPLTVDNTDPTAPAVEASLNQAGGLADLDSNLQVHQSQLKKRFVRFSYSTQNPSIGNIGGTDGVVGANYTDNNNFASKVELARVIVPGDPSSSGDYTYNRRDHLQATITLLFTGSDDSAYLVWVKNSTGARLDPTFASTRPVATGSGGYIAQVNCDTYATPLPASDNETYTLCVWMNNSGDALIYSANASDPGAHDCITATSEPV